MEKITVKINEGGAIAKEVNRFQKLVYKDYISEMSPIIGRRASIEMYHRNNSNWQEAESKLRTFTIDFGHLNELFEAIEAKTGGVISHTQIGYESGTLREAEIIDKEKLIIRIV